MAMSPSYSPFDEGADSWSGKDLVEPRDKTTSVASDSDTEAPSEHAARAEELLSESETEEGTKPPSPLHTEPPSPLHGASENEDASSTLSAQEKNKANQDALALLQEVSDAVAGKADDTDMIDEALEQIAHKAMARRSRRAARKESRRRLRAERKAEHHELRAGMKAAPATRVAKTGSDVFHARKRKASAKLDAVVNEMKLEDKDPIIARCDDVLDEMKRKAVRRGAPRRAQDRT
jgi:hypothetical protein